MTLAQFTSTFIQIGFLFSPAIAVFMISHYYFLNKTIWFILTESAIAGFCIIIYFGGVLGSDVGMPFISIMYPLFLFLLNFIFYYFFDKKVSVSLAISLLVVYLLNNTFEVNFFIQEILYNRWIPANLLFGFLPMHPFMWLYAGVVFTWLFQVAQIRLSRGPGLIMLLLMISSFIPGESGIFDTSLPHHVLVSCLQFFLFLLLVLGWSKLKVNRRIIIDYSKV